MSDGAKKRGRPKGSLNKPKGNGHDAEPKIPTSDDRPAAEASNGSPKVAKEPLSDEQRQAVFFGHKEVYEKALAKKKAMDAAFKVACKLIKSEGTKLVDVKLAIELEDPEGSTEMRDRFQRQLEVARWVGAEVGTQFQLFEDRTPFEDKVRDDGKRAGLRGEPCSPPKTLPGNLMTVWADSWSDGQAVLASKHLKQKAEDAAAFDDDLPPAA